MSRISSRVKVIQGATFADLERRKKGYTERTGQPVIDFPSDPPTYHP